MRLKRVAEERGNELGFPLGHEKGVGWPGTAEREGGEGKEEGEGRREKRRVGSREREGWRRGKGRG